MRKLTLFFGVVLIMVLPIISAELILRYSLADLDHSIKSIVLVLSWLLLYFLSFVLPIFLILIQLITLFFDSTDKMKKIKQFGCYFLITIIIFANSYYHSSAVNDYGDAVGKYIWYSYLNYTPERKEFVLKNSSFLKDARAFKGIDDRLFYGVDYPMYTDDWANSKGYPIELVFDNLGENAPDDYLTVIKPKMDSRGSVYSSCFLFSASVLTNSESFDIVPMVWDTKLMVAFEKLLSFAYLILFIGMLLNDWWSEKKLIKKI